LSTEGDDLFRPVHDGTVGSDGAARDCIVILEVDNDNFWLGRVGELLAYANVVVGF